MENSPDWEQQTLINELLQGRELAKQLQRHLNSTNCSHETRKLLVHKILSSYNKALSMLKWDRSVGGEPVPQPNGAAAAAAIGWSESPRSSGSPLSEDSDRDFKKDHGPKDVSRKRKSMLRWTEQVQVCQGTGLEGPLVDGYSWRKYGQKDILGAKFPRGYYRCTHRNGQGCVATKQVQRSDEDPTIFEITYRGSHSCTQPQGSHLTPAPSAAYTLQIQEPNTAEQADHQQLLISPPQLQNQQPRSQEVLLNFQTGLRAVTTDDLEDTTRKQGIPPFYFPSTSHSKPENYIHSSPSVVDDHNNFVGNFLSPSLASSATSGSNCFLVAPTQMASFGGNQALSGPEPELPEKMVSATATPATNPATVGFDFPFDHFEPTFSIDNPGIFFP